MSAFTSNPYHPLNLSIMFTGNPLDRKDAQRRSKDQETLWQNDPKAQYMAFIKGKIIVDSANKILWFHRQDMELNSDTIIVFLGMSPQNAPCFGIQLNDLDQIKWSADGIQVKDLRSVALKERQPSKRMAIAAQAKSMLAWHRSHSYCSKCGAPSVLTKMGYERQCLKCGACHYPRTDPVVIMLAIHEQSDSILVGRPYQVQDGMYSALAGYMEPGETIEEAVARELYEEAGIKPTKVNYVASQPWPWPSTLMLGCFAEVEDKTLTVDSDELVDARWINRATAEETFNKPTQDFYFPPSLAIARQLIELWLSGTFKS